MLTTTSIQAIYLKNIIIQVINAASFLHGAATCNIYQLKEGWNDDLKIAGSSPLYDIIFLLTMFACWHTSLQVKINN